jgi:hypothetical protein
MTLMDCANSVFLKSPHPVGCNGGEKELLCTIHNRVLITLWIVIGVAQLRFTLRNLCLNNLIFWSFLSASRFSEKHNPADRSYHHSSSLLHLSSSMKS